jgi:hypothetical protein
MRTAKRLALIAAGYAFSVGAGLAAVALNELLMPADAAQSSGMAAFGDIILFVLVAGFFSLGRADLVLAKAIDQQRPHLSSPRVK